MARPLLISAGSRGDFEPFTALAVSLANSHAVKNVTYMVQPDYLSSVPANKQKLNRLQLPYSLSDMYPHFARARQRATPRSTAVEITWAALGLAAANVILPATDFVMSEAKSANCDVVITTLMSWPVAYVVSRKLRVPLVMISFQPDTTSAYFPHLNLYPKTSAENMFRLRNGDVPEPSEAHVETCRTLHRLHFVEYEDRLRAMCARFDLRPVTIDDAFDIFSGTAPDLVTLNAVEAGLCPPPPDAGPNTHTIGSLAADYIPKGYEPKKYSAVHRVWNCCWDQGLWLDHCGACGEGKTSFGQYR